MRESRIAVIAAVSLSHVMWVLGACVPTIPPAAEVPGEAAPVRLRERLLERALAGLVFADGRVVATASRPLSDPVPDPEQLLSAGRSLAAVDAARRRVLEDGGVGDMVLLGRCLLAAEDPRRALAAFRTALDLDPERVVAHLGAAAALRQLARVSEAIDHFQAVLALAPDHPRAHAGLAVAYTLDGSPSLARFHLQRAERLGTPVPGALRALIETGRPPRLEVQGAGESAGILTVGPPVRVDAGGASAANETSVAATSGMVPQVLVGWNDDRVSDSSLGVGFSTDGGASWSDSLLAVPADVDTGIVGDPMTAFDPRTGDLWIGAIAFSDGELPSAVLVARQPAGMALEPTVVVWQDPGFVDKCWMTAGQGPGDADSTRVYVAYSLGLQASADQGATWSPPTPLGTGNGFLPRVGPDGELYVAYRTVGLEQDHMLRRSLDGGASFEPAVLIAPRMNALLDDSIPGRFRISGYGSLAVDPGDGQLYLVYADDSGGGDVDLYLTLSSDGGSTWSVPRAFQTDLGDQFMPWLEADDRGGLHLVFYDTRNTPQDDGDFDGWLDAYYAYSSDRGDSWVEARLTAAPFDSGDAQFGSFSQFVGDYQGLAVSGDLAFPTYASTAGGDLDIFAHTIRIADAIFADGFESGDLGAWSSSSP